MALRPGLVRSSLCTFKVQHAKAGMNLEFVRYRKPRFVPRAASKVYRVQERKPADPEEVELIKNWIRIYGTQVKSIRGYLEMHHKKMKALAALEAEPVLYSEVIAEVKRKNDAFNLETQELKKPILAEVHEREKLIHEKMVERDHHEKDEMRQKAMEKVKFEMENFREYFHPENLDEKIERLLNTRADYTFPISGDGEVVKNQSADDYSKESESMKKK